MTDPFKYFPRRLRQSGDESGKYLNEDELASIKANKIILAEPGMGKTELIRELGKCFGIEPVNAVRFMRSKDPLKFVIQAKPILIDALDEALARREGDAIDEIASQLEAAGSPDFIISCRAREWQSRNQSVVRQAYGADPLVFTLEPLNRAEAAAFLRERHPKANSEHVLSHLAERGLSDLYANPLTLGLMGQLAEADVLLPSSRAALFERISALIWKEHDPDRQETGLAQLTEIQALSAAGAISTALLFSGAEAATSLGAAQSQDTDLRLSELEHLSDSEAVRAIFASKLFHGVGPGRAKPIHRVLAEFLASRWLSDQAKTPRVRRRLLAQFHGGGAVPASLRGMHAWLAYHSAEMAEEVINADPFGQLRYGETSTFSTTQANCLIDALCNLAAVDPYFRASDWDVRTATGLMIPQLRDRVGPIIASETSNSHLRSLLIEALEDTPLASDLADTLEQVMLSTRRFYRERHDAARALLPYRNEAWWQAAVAQLHDQGTNDSTRLARTLIQLLDGNFSDELIVSVLFAEIGLIISPVPRVKIRQHMIRFHGDIVEVLSSDRLITILDLLADYVDLIGKPGWEEANDIAELTASVLIRALNENLVDQSHAPRMWRWLAIFRRAETFHRDAKEKLVAHIRAAVPLRRAIQAYALDDSNSEASIWTSDFELSRRLVGLAAYPGDIAWHLERLAKSSRDKASRREDWENLLRLAGSRHGIDSQISKVARQVIELDASSEAFLRKVENPPKPKWEIKQEKLAKKNKRKALVTTETRRRAYEAHRTELSSGELKWILYPAHAYLGRLSDVSKELSGRERLAEWLTADLATDCLKGFENVLHRTDLPSACKLSKGFAEGTLYNFSFPIMVGLLERVRRGKTLNDLNLDLLTAGLLLCQNDWQWRQEDDIQPLRTALESAVIPDAPKRRAFIQLWMSPSLAMQTPHIHGLYMLAHDAEWLPVGAELAAEWLTSVPDLHENVEAELIDCLTHAGQVELLREVALARESSTHHSFDNMLSWLAVDVVARFEEVQPKLIGIGRDHPEFLWFLRNRVELERRGSMLPLSIAQAGWIISEFRVSWPYATMVGSSSGNTNPHDATDFIRSLLGSIANDTSDDAAEALQLLISQQDDSYSELIRHLAAEQRQKRAEAAFSPISVNGLVALLSDGRPANHDDLKSLVLEELMVAQKKLLGDDIDQVRDFWADDGRPYGENRCRDRLAAMIDPELARYGIQRLTEADMPVSKRADLAFALDDMQLPMEVKGQWHSAVWDAAASQLDSQYLIDWRSEQRGIYCVLWFGECASSTGRRLKAHPGGKTAPLSAKHMKDLLIERIPEARRSFIEVVVLDLTAGRPT